MLAKWRFERALDKLRNSGHAVLRDYANADWPDAKAKASSAPYLALDFELDGLRKDAHLLEAGWLTFDGRTIPLSGALSVDIRSNATLDDEAVTIHGIGEQRAAQGEKISTVIAALVKALTGRVMVAHAAGIERHALQRAVKDIYGEDLPVRAVCTLTLEQRLHPRVVGPAPYRLGPCRRRYGLPSYTAHAALTDAIAAAELYQAQLSRMAPGTALSEVEAR